LAHAVTLQAAIEAELPFLRAEAEARMLDEFAVMISTGGWVFDPDLGEDVEELALLFTTLGRVKVEGGLAVRAAEVGGRTSASVVRSLHIPVTSDTVPVGAVAFCTAVHATSDPTLLGARLTIGGPAPGSQTTARRLEVTEVLS
jgi:hypothetical protein